ncbi:hypothetical protein ACVTMO_04065 [Pseudomonas segetis]
MSKQIDPKVIKDLAADIRVIQDFAANNGFDNSLLVVNPVSPASSDNFFKKNDRWIIKGLLLVAFALVVVALVLDWLSGKPELLVFIFGIVVLVVASSYVHKLYDNGGVTTVMGVGGLLVLLVAIGVVSPQQIADGVEKKYIPQDDKKEEKKEENK